MFHVQTLKPANPVGKTDAIIVLTGGHLRIGKGLELYANEMAPQLFISGVHNLVTDEDIKAMWHGEKPLPECCITLGRDAATTIGNAQEVNKWIETNNIKTIRLVTSAYHMPRAMLEFTSILDKEDVGIIINPITQSQDLHNTRLLKYLNLTFDEYNKVLFRLAFLTLYAREQPA
ncbi:MAG: YdcF family protein [Alphaproteobacteria bacterium]|nr:YdcF family protein [Alphaproteobacteria bacterium]